MINKGPVPSGEFSVASSVGWAGGLCCLNRSDGLSCGSAAPGAGTGEDERDGHRRPEPGPSPASPLRVPHRAQARGCAEKGAQAAAPPEAQLFLFSNSG